MVRSKQILPFITEIGKNILTWSKQVLLFITETGSDFSSFAAEIGKDTLSFTSSFAVKIVPTVSSWLPILLTILITIGMLIYLFRKRGKQQGWR